ncbi:MAG: rhomboid family intramembrane serine protease [Rhizobiales bacterium]|nr:rhomboid family intramembrane serine protease [Hyphomicrobiales bacterium]
MRIAVVCLAILLLLLLPHAGNAAGEPISYAQTSPWFLYGWGLFGLAAAIIVGLLKNRRASVVVGALIGALIAAHVFRVWNLYTTDYYGIYRFLFSFIPARYLPGNIFDGGPIWVLAALWSPFTYTFLHGDGSHLFGNCIALFVFGRTVAWRIGTWRFLLFFFASGAASALGHMIFNWGSPVSLIGASGSGFAILAATLRFVPRTNDRLRALFWPDKNVRTVPLASPIEVFTEPRSFVYFLICMILYPLGFVALLLGTLGNVALAGHVGGFLFGLFAFGLFDRRTRADVSGSGVPEISEPPPESLGLTFLRIGAVIFMIYGFLRALLFYGFAFLV